MAADTAVILSRQLRVTLMVRSSPARTETSHYKNIISTRVGQSKQRTFLLEKLHFGAVVSIRGWNDTDHTLVKVIRKIETLKRLSINTKSEISAPFYKTMDFSGCISGCDTIKRTVQWTNLSKFAKTSQETNYRKEYNFGHNKTPTALIWGVFSRRSDTPPSLENRLFLELAHLIVSSALFTSFVSQSKGPVSTLGFFFLDCQ